MDDKVIELIGTIRELIENLIIRIDDISTEFKTNGIMDQERVLNLLDDLNALAEGIAAIQPNSHPLDITELQDKLGMMTSAMENNDMFLFADIMQFELKDLLSYWKDNIVNIKG